MALVGPSPVLRPCLLPSSVRQHLPAQPVLPTGKAGSDKLPAYSVPQLKSSYQLVSSFLYNVAASVASSPLHILSLSLLLEYVEQWICCRDASVATSALNRRYFECSIWMVTTVSRIQGNLRWFYNEAADSIWSRLGFLGTVSQYPSGC